MSSTYYTFGMKDSLASCEFQRLSPLDLPE